MSFGPTRFLYNNFLTSPEMITADSQASGVVGGAEKIQGTSGVAIMVSYGSYSGTSGLRYTVQIVSPGDVGVATFRWKTSETPSGTWEATGITTLSTPTLLNYNTYIFWVGGTGVDFEQNDTWILETQATYSTENLFDKDRNTIFRSGSTFNIEFNLGSARHITAIILYGHNLTSATSTATLQMNTTSSWASPPYTQSLTIANPIIIYVDENYQYQRISITDTELSYVEFSQIYIGDYLELSHNAKWDTPLTPGLNIIESGDVTGINRRKIYTKQDRIQLDYQILKYADIDNLITMQKSLYHTDTGIIDRLFLHLFSDDATKYIWLMDWTNINAIDYIFKYVTHGSIMLEFSEQVNTRR